ncbi:MAG: hypothetical protein QNJ11_06785 [Woeseiaceae bacterium]|nr:hypothetical protein [Woeseiaceae bacterium]
MKRLVALFALLLLTPAQLPAQAAEPESASDWYSWQIVGGEASGQQLFVQKSRGKLVRIALSGQNCGFARREPATHLGELSTDDAVTMLLDIVMNERLDKALRNEALFGLAQSGSDRAFALLDRLILGG